MRDRAAAYSAASKGSALPKGSDKTRNPGMGILIYLKDKKMSIVY